MPLYLLIQEDLYPRCLVGSNKPVTLWLKLWVLGVGVGGNWGERMECSIAVFAGGHGLWPHERTGWHLLFNCEFVVDVNNPQQEPRVDPSALSQLPFSSRLSTGSGSPPPQTFAFHSENIQLGVVGTSVISACGRLGQAHLKFKVSMGYTLRLCLKINKQINR